MYPRFGREARPHAGGQRKYPAGYCEHEKAVPFSEDTALFMTTFSGRTRRDFLGRLRAHRLRCEATQVVQLRAAHTADTYDADALDDR